MICSCPHEFHADKYHQNETRVDILIAMPDIKDSLLRHFVTVSTHIPSRSYYSSKEWSPHERSTTFKRISFDNDEMKMYWINRFHLIFVEYDHNMYLLLNQLKHTTSIHLKLRLESGMPCPSIRDLLNNTIVNFAHPREIINIIIFHISND
jgi:hypothetical protein